MSKKTKLIIGGIVLGMVVGIVGTLLYNSSKKPQRIEEVVNLINVLYEDEGYANYNEEFDEIIVTDITNSGYSVEQYKDLQEEISEIIKEKNIMGTECKVYIFDSITSDSDILIISNDGITTGKVK